MPHIKIKLLILIIIIYLMLLTPYAIISKTGESGIIIENQSIEVNSLPNDIKDILINKKDTYNIILIKDLLAKEKYQIGKNKYQISSQIKVVISEETQEVGSFVKIDNIKNDIYITSNAIPAINKSFDKLIIGDVKKVRFGGIIEIIYHRLTPILTLSSLNSLVGGLLVVLILTFLFNRMVALWNIPALITCYSFQSFLTNIIASMNHLEIETMSMLFGLLFIPALFLTFKLKTFEETQEGKKMICDLYEFNIKIVKKVLSKFGI